MLQIDWGAYGKYELRLVDPAAGIFEGSVLGESKSIFRLVSLIILSLLNASGQPENWRRATYLSPLSPHEALLLAEGGSEWQ